MAGRVYHPTDLLEINWSDLDGVEFRRREGSWPQEGCQGHSSLDAPSELNLPQKIPSLLSFALLVPQAEG